MLEMEMARPMTSPDFREQVLREHPALFQCFVDSIRLEMARPPFPRKYVEERMAVRLRRLRAAGYAGHDDDEFRHLAETAYVAAREYVLNAPHRPCPACAYPIMPYEQGVCQDCGRTNGRGPARPLPRLL